MSKKKSKWQAGFLLAALLIIGFFYRIYGLSNNYSFWTDENHAAIFTRVMFEEGRLVLENGFNTGLYQLLLYGLGTISAKIFGLDEFSLRLTSVVFGFLTILGVYFLGRQMFGIRVGLLATTLATFLKIEVLWSRQFRPYQALQLFYLLSAYFILRLVEEKEFKFKYFFGFLLSGILASLSHGLGLVVLFSGIIFIFLTKHEYFLRRRYLILYLVFFGGIVMFYWKSIFHSFSGLGGINNFLYYRVFLTHNYLPLVIFSSIGGLFLLVEKELRKSLLLTIVIGMQIFIVSFLLPQPFVRYFYIVFPFLIILGAYGVAKTADRLGRLSPSFALFPVFIFCLFVGALFLSMSKKLVILPLPTYSLNEDMQEIPEVDWKKVYGFVENTMKDSPKTVLITNWNDLPVWYLGEGKLDYILRKINTSTVDSLSGAKIVNTLESFEKVINDYQNGLLILDSWDNQVPDGIREFSRNNLKKELEVDRLYQIQPRYWPVTVYSWGFEN